MEESKPVALKFGLSLQQIMDMVSEEFHKPSKSHKSKTAIVAVCLDTVSCEDG